MRAVAAGSGAPDCASLSGPWTDARRSGSLHRMDEPALPQVFVDYSPVGRATRIRTRVKAVLREGLRDGDLVLVLGDDVPPARARVVRAAAGDPNVEFELLGD